MLVISALRNQSLQERHWNEIEVMIGITIAKNKALTMKELMDKNMFRYKDRILKISNTANNEMTIEVMLNKIKEVWSHQSFRLVPHPGRETWVITGIDDITTQLDESLVTILMIKSSRYVAPIKAQVEEWERKLYHFSRVLEEWMTCQRMWLYLEQILSNQDIVKQLSSHEMRSFDEVNSEWKNLMRRVQENSNALRCGTSQGILQTLQECNANLERIQKCLDDYLETKRMIFPRFNFVSNDDLLEILSQSKDPNVVQAHMPKLFANIKYLDIRQLPRQPFTVYSMTSAEGETMTMPKNVRARGLIEQWLGNVEQGMFDSVKKHLKECLQDYNRTEDFVAWISADHPGQAVLTIGQIVFCKKVEKAFTSKRDGNADKQQEQLECEDLEKIHENLISNLVKLANMVSSKMSQHKRLTYEANLILNVHNRDTVKRLIDNDIASPDNFEWAKQLRVEWSEAQNHCLIKQADLTMHYGYEYLGCSPRLVLTPLTDRCYLTLTGALHLNLGGNPAGPAGTGKTETVKDLAKAFGKQCVVFNCSERIDYDTIGKLFIGLVQAGSWCCFDEFNRMDLEVLSVISTQLYQIKAAKNVHTPRFMFESREIRLNPTCGIFVTMNPTYAGRVELPDNLKSYFRPVAMMVPDYSHIVEIILFSQGFIYAKRLCRKIENLYQLSSSQLSQQTHYDFGMRAIKHVLIMAGKARMEYLAEHKCKNDSLSEHDEAQIIIQALYSSNLPRLISQDIPIFRLIMDDLFPGIPILHHKDVFFEKAIKISLRDLGLQYWDNQILKIAQLYSQLLVRHAVMLVGPSGSGKSTVRNVLQRSLSLIPSLILVTGGAGYGNAASVSPSGATANNIIDLVDDDDDDDKQGKDDADDEDDDNETNSYSDSVADTLSKSAHSATIRRSAKHRASAATKNAARFRMNQNNKGKVECTTINPKCVTLNQLYGSVDANTLEWRDGLLSSVTKKYAAATNSSLMLNNANAAANQNSSASPSNEAAGEAVKRGAVNEFQASKSNTFASTSETLSTKKDADEATTTNSASVAGNEQAGEHEKVTTANVQFRDWQWIILDGPVDTDWVENLNTVLDDSKLLCLANGERVTIAASMRYLFEVEDLQHASPATVSRCAMVYMDEFSINWRLRVKSWMQSRDFSGIPKPVFDYLWTLMDYSVDQALKFCSRMENFHIVPGTSVFMLIKGLLAILEGYLKFMLEFGGFGEAETLAPNPDSSLTASHSKVKPRIIACRPDGKNYFLQKNPKEWKSLIGKIYVFAFTWSFGASFNRLDEADNDTEMSSANETSISDVTDDFDVFVREMFNVEPPYGIRMPPNDRHIYFYFIDLEGGGYMPWSVLVPSAKSIVEERSRITNLASSNFGDHEDGGGGGGGGGGGMLNNTADPEIIITIDQIRYMFLVALMILNKNPVLLTGDTGSGKSIIVRNLLRRLTSEQDGFGFESSTVLGAILNYTDQSSVFMDNISNLMKNNDDFELNSQEYDANAKSASDALAKIRLTSANVQFNSQTSSKRALFQMTNQMVKRGRGILGAPKGKRMAVFLDDIALPKPDKFRVQAPLEMLRQWLEQDGFYNVLSDKKADAGGGGGGGGGAGGASDGKSLTQRIAWRSVVDCTLVATAGPQFVSGKSLLTNRLLKNFCLLTLPQQSIRTLQHIFQAQLGSFYQAKNFNSEVQFNLGTTVNCATSVYNKVRQWMRCTPNKLHYSVNLRHISKVFKGFYLTNEKTVVNKAQCASLLIHELCREFQDRLVCASDQTTFLSILADEIQAFFKIKLMPEQIQREPVYYGNYFDVSILGAREKVYQPITEFDRLQRVTEDLYLKRSINMKQLQHQPANIVFFKETLQHIQRTARIFSQKQGHVFQIGINGIGKYTIIQLTSIILKIDLYQLKLTKDYGINDFRNDLKKMIELTAVQNFPIILFLSDSNGTLKEEFMEDVSVLLNSGFIPDLYETEELEALISSIKKDAEFEGFADSRQSLFEFCVKRVKQNFHLAISMSPSHPKFRIRCRENPSFINCCNVDYYMNWNETSLTDVAKYQLNSLLDPSILSKVNSSSFSSSSSTTIQKDDSNFTELVAQICVKIHKHIFQIGDQFQSETKRSYSITPGNFVSFVNLLSKMLNQNNAKYSKIRARLQSGLDKLTEANRLVALMHQDLIDLGPQIELKSQEAKNLLEKLEVDRKSVEEVKKIVLESEEITKMEAKIVEDYSNECQQDLDDVVPALENARLGLQKITKASISEIRTFSNPPVVLKNIMLAVCVLLNEEDTWENATKLMINPSFLDRFVTFDQNNLSDKVFKKLKKYTSQESFNVAVATKVCVASASICLWVLSIEKYNKIQKMIKPKQKKMEDARKALELANQKLEYKQHQLTRVRTYLNELQIKYQNSVDQHEEFKNRKKTTAIRIERASVLINALEKERDRWIAGMTATDEKLKNLVGDTILSAAFTSYCGTLTQRYRDQITKLWIADVLEITQHTENPETESVIKFAPDYNFVRSEFEELDVLNWHNCALPHDASSRENSVIMQRSNRWCLLIDPQGQAKRFLLNSEGQHMKIINIRNPSYVEQLERAIRVGETVLLENVGNDLDTILNDLILKKFKENDGFKTIALGENEVEYSEKFKLFLSTSVQNPKFLPSIHLNVNIINFCVTQEGLQEQLLSRVVQKEKPEIEAERNRLLINYTSDMKQLKKMEDMTLELLQNSTTTILDDEELSNSLKNSREIALEIEERIKIADNAEKSLSLARQNYRDVALRGSSLYFAISSLSILNIMYQFPLDWFQNLYDECIGEIQAAILQNENDLNPAQIEDKALNASSQIDPIDQLDLQRKINDMKQLLTKRTYDIVSCSLFSEHQVLLTFLITTSVLRDGGHQNLSNAGQSMDESISDEQWNVFINGHTLANMSSIQSQQTEADNRAFQLVCSRYNWMDEKIWRYCLFLEAVLPGKFRGLCKSLADQNSVDFWNFARSTSNLFRVDQSRPAEPQQHEKEFRLDRLSKFDLLILKKTLRPTDLQNAMQNFARSLFDRHYLYGGPASLSKVFSRIRCTTPLILILGPGADPYGNIQKLSLELRSSTTNLDSISLGKGQGKRAEELIQKAQIQKGRWVFLQNCHLATSWMPRLAEIIDGFDDENKMDAHFRLILSSKPDEKFPLSVLNRGIKLVIESAGGLKNLLLQNFCADSTGLINQERFDAYSSQLRRVMFSMCYFHSILLERKTYGSLGFNFSYEFNNSDFTVAMMQLEKLASAQDGAQWDWDALEKLVGDITYCGRVTDDWDKRCLKVYLNRFQNERIFEADYSFDRDRALPMQLADQSFVQLNAALTQLTDEQCESAAVQIIGLGSNAKSAAVILQSRALFDQIRQVQSASSPQTTSKTGLNSATSATAELQHDDAMLLEIAKKLYNMFPDNVEDVFADPQRKSRDGFGELMNREQDRIASSSPTVNSTRMTPSNTKQSFFSSALNIFLRQEIDQFNILLKKIRANLVQIQAVLKGEESLSDEFEVLLNSIRLNKVPETWKTYLSCKSLSEWSHDLKVRVDFISCWANRIISGYYQYVEAIQAMNAAPVRKKSHEEEARLAAQANADSSTYNPASFWLSGLHFPQGFLTSILQDFARHANVSVDSIRLQSRVVQTSSLFANSQSLIETSRAFPVMDCAFSQQQQPQQQPQQQRHDPHEIFVFGLYLDNAAWSLELGHLVENTSHNRFCKLPEVHIKPVVIQEEARQSGAPPRDESDAYYTSPIYRTVDRRGEVTSTGQSTNYITSMQLAMPSAAHHESDAAQSKSEPDSSHSNYWILRGTAVLTQCDV